MRTGYVSGVLMSENAVPLLFFFSGLNWKNRAFPLFVFLLEESLKLIAVADLQELRLKQ